MVSRMGSIVAPFCVYLSSVWTFLPQVPARSQPPDAAGRQCSQLPSLPGPVRSQFRVQWWRFTETLLTAPRWGRRAGLLFYVGRSPSAPGEPFIAVVAAVEAPSPAPHPQSLEAA